MNFLKGFGDKTFSSLKVRNYRLYFIGQAISLSGTWMQSIAQGLLVLKITNSGTDLGIVTALQFLPILFFGPIGGLVSDRFSKRKILIITQAIFCILAFTLGILVVLNQVQLWMIEIIALAMGFVNLIDNPARQTFVMEMVGQDQLANAVTLSSSEVNLTRAIGPAIAGGLIVIVGFASCFILNGISYIAVIISLFMIKPSELHLTPTVKKAKGQLREGFAYVRSNAILRNTLIMLAIIGTLTYEFQVSLPLIAEFTFHDAVNGYALLMAAFGMGAAIGGVLTAGKKKTSAHMLINIALFFGLSILITAIMPSLWLTALLLLFVGYFSINFTSLGNVVLQLESTPEMRGRVMSLWTIAFLGSTPIGGPIVGWVGEVIGPRWSLAVGGIAALVAAGFGALFLKKANESLVTATIVIEDKQSETIENLRK